MPSLRDAGLRFQNHMEVIDGGSGFFTGFIDEPDQGQVPAFIFSQERRLLRVEPGCPVSAGMVIRTHTGAVFMVGTHGNSERQDETVFKSFRLIEATKQFKWQTRLIQIEPITGLEKEAGLSDPILVWGVYEPGQELFDRQVHTPFEQARFITNRPIRTSDLIDGTRLKRVDKQLGLFIGDLL